MSDSAVLGRVLGGQLIMPQRLLDEGDIVSDRVFVEASSCHHHLVF